MLIFLSAGDGSWGLVYARHVSEPRVHTKNPCVVMSDYNYSAEAVGTGGFLQLPGQAD